MAKKTILFFSVISILCLTNPLQVNGQYNCENRAPYCECPTESYPTCYETTYCGPPNRTAGTEYVNGVYKVYCAEPANSCGNSGAHCCKDPPYCHTLGEVCTLDDYCLTPTSIPTSTPIPPPPAPENGGSSEEGIDFGILSGAIPGLKTVFLPESSPNVSGIISVILPYLFVIAGLLLLFYLIFGGFHMMTAANDEKGLAEAKGKITNALIGFLLLFVSYWLVQILGHVLGIQIF